MHKYRHFSYDPELLGSNQESVKCVILKKIEKNR